MTRALPVDLVARRSELRVAEDELVAGRGVLVTGPEGTGRTAFAAAVAASIERGGAAPLWIVATRSLSLVPFGALGWLLGDGAASSDVAATIGRLTTALGRHGGGALTVLVVDDVHLLDEPSAEVVLQALNCGAVAVLATAVDGAPLPTTVKRLVDASVLQAVALRPLARDDVETVAAEMVGGPIALTTAELLWRWSAGLPGC